MKKRKCTARWLAFVLLLTMLTNNLQYVFAETAEDLAQSTQTEAHEDLELNEDSINEGIKVDTVEPNDATDTDMDEDVIEIPSTDEGTTDYKEVEDVDSNIPTEQEAEPQQGESSQEAEQQVESPREAEQYIEIIYMLDEDTIYDRVMILSGSKVDEPSAPDKDVFPQGMNSFEGWYEFGSEEPFDFKNTAVELKLTLFARFSERYQVKFLNANDTVVSTVLVESGGTITQEFADEQKDELTNVEQNSFFEFWFDAEQGVENGKIEFPLTVKGNMTLKPHYSKYHMLLFISDGEQVDPLNFFVGQPTEKPKDPIRKGYDFSGWVYYEDQAKPFVFGEPIEEHTYLYATWKPVQTNYTVVYWLEKNNFAGTPVPGEQEHYSYIYSEVKQITSEQMSAVTEISATAKANNIGLKYGSFQNADNKVVLGDGTTVINVYCKRNVYKITFDLYNNYASDGTVRSMNYRGQLYQNTDIATSWYSIDAKYEQDVSELIPNSGTATFSVNQGSQKFNGWKPKNGATDDKPILTSMWATKRTLVTYEMLPDNPNAAGYTVVATWGTGDQRVVNYWVEALPGETGETKTYNGKTYIKSTLYSEKSIFIQSGSSLGAKQLEGLEYIGGNSGVVASTYDFYYNRNRYKVSFNTMGGSEISTIENIPYGLDISNLEPDDPTKFVNGFESIFEGWYTDSNYYQVFDFANLTMPFSDIVLFAKWKEVPLRVKYYDSILATAALIDTQDAIKGESITPPYEIGQVVEGKGVLLKWLYQVNGIFISYNMNTTVQKDINLYASWQTDDFKVTYDAGIGTGNVPNDEYSYALGIDTLVLGSRELQPPTGFVFAGWQINGSGKAYYPGSKITVNADINLVARYLDMNDPDTIQVIYLPNYDGGVSFERYYTTEDNPIALSTLEDAQEEGMIRSDYSLKYWTLTQEDEVAGALDLGGSYSQSELGITSKKIVLYAQWKGSDPQPTLTKVSNLNEVKVGQEIEYTITAGNTAPNGVWSNATATDILPSTVTYVRSSSEEGVDVTNDANKLTIAFGDINSGTSKSVTIIVSVNNTAAPGEKIVNSVVLDNIGGPGQPTGPTEPIMDENPPEVLVSQSMLVEKKLDASHGGQTEFVVGETVTYEIKVTNNGNIALTNVVVTDSMDVDGSWTQTIPTLAVGAVETFSFSYTVKATDVGIIKNTAAATSTETDLDPQAPVFAGEVEIKVPEHPSILVEKTLDPSHKDQTEFVAGETVTYEIKVTNNGNIALTNVVVTDSMDVDGSWTQTIPTLAVGAAQTFSFSYTVKATDVGIIKNIAVATSTETDLDPQAPVFAGEVEIKVPEHPSMLVEKTLDLSHKDQTEFVAGETVTYEIKVTNNGNIALTNVVVTDSMDVDGSWTQTIPTLAVGAVQTFSFSYTVKATDVGIIKNTAVATSTETDLDPETPVFAGEVEIKVPEQPSMLVEKTLDASHKDRTEFVVGETVSYEIKVTNNGNIALTNVVVTDSMDVDGSWTQTIPTLAVGATQTFSFSYTVKATDVGVIKNTAVATSTETDLDPQAPVFAGEVEINVLERPSILVEKMLDASHEDRTEFVVGETVTYEIKVTNNGNIALTNVVVTDSMDVDGSWTQTIPTLAVGATQTFSFSYTVKAIDVGMIKNIAVATSTETDLDPQAPVFAGEVEIKVLEHPSILVEKTLDASHKDQTEFTAGETVTYEIKVTNNGNIALTNVVVTDSMDVDGSWTQTIPTLAVGATQTFSFSYTVKATDVGVIKNIAVATSTESDLDPEAPVFAGEVEINVPGNPSMLVEKTLDASHEDQTEFVAGETVTYEIKVTNNGNIALTNVVVTDSMDKDGSWTQTIPTLAVGAVQTFSFSYIVKATDIGSIKNTAVATSTETDLDPEAPVFAGEVEINVLENPSMLVEKTLDASHKDRIEFVVGETVTYEIKVTNSGNTELTNVVVTDSMDADGSWTQTIPTLAVGAVQTFSFSYTVKATDVGIVKNTAVATSAETDLNPEAPVFAGEVEIKVLERPSMLVEKTLDASHADQIEFVAGETVTYEIKVTNNGNIALTNVVVTDSMDVDGSWTQTIPSLAVGAAQTFSFSYTVKATDVGIIKNIAVATSTETELDPEAPVFAGEVEIKVPERPSMLVEKTLDASHKNQTEFVAGETITYKIKVTNNGNIALTNVVVTDSMDVDGSWTQTIPTLAVGATRTFSFNYTVKATDVGIIKNTAIATSTETDLDPKAPIFAGEVEIEVPEHPSMLVEKTIDESHKDRTEFVVGETVIYKIKVTNNGNIPLTDIKVFDSLDKDGKWTKTIPTLAVGATQTFSFTYTIKATDVGILTNTATVKYSASEDYESYDKVKIAVKEKPAEKEKPIGKEKPIRKGKNSLKLGKNPKTGDNRLDSILYSFGFSILLSSYVIGARLKKSTRRKLIIKK